MNIQLDVEPEPTFLGDITITLCVAGLLFAGGYLFWRVCYAVAAVMA